MPRKVRTPLSPQSSPEEVELAINQAIGRTDHHNVWLAIMMFVAVLLGLICSVVMVVGLYLQNPMVVMWFRVSLIALLLILCSLMTLMSYYDSRLVRLERELIAYRQTGDLEKVLAWHLKVTYTNE